ncbi:AMP-binding protein [Bizionia arctica]|uniref:Long-chain-fatty-acid--CoA ligase n=1 Tax=Bizionia arctica TaxID=1495645 RepID=A0A917GE09_9FLAO|nr:AMP-binding protein [Bizionia arctica]GGG39977.1 long-chain-fatty-acid--CoA ligase [Bizionia arctica]
MNVFDYFFESTKNLGKDFLLGSKETISFKKLYNNSLKIATFLNRYIGANKNIILISPNSKYFITAYLGILKSGNTCVPLNFAIEQENLDFILNTTECDTVFMAKSARSKYKIPSHIQVIEEEDLDQIIANQSIVDYYVEVEKNQLAEIIFTSGSTGIPKGVMISHENIIANTNSIISYLNLTSKDTMCVVLPFFYCYGLSLLHTHLRVGGSIVLNNSFMFLGAVLNDLNDYKCTGFAGVPSHFQILLKKSKTFKTTPFPDLRYVTQAGGKLHTVFIDEFVKAFPKKEFYVMYGQTEATARLSYLEPKMIHKKTSSIGKPIPDVTFKIVDDMGKTLGVNQEGELLAKGKNIMLGYYKEQSETKMAIKNSWLYTGDVAVVDEDGYYYLKARKKEILKVAGKRVSPKEIEEVILSVEEVMDCTISGYDDDLFGEAIQATIVANGNFDEVQLKEKILHACSKKLALYKIPQKVIFEKVMKMSASGKKVK